MQQEVIPFDLVRMVFGSDPPLFYLEIVVRILLIYAYSLLLIRWVGGRGIGQMSTVEFLLVIALGSAVGDTMFYPQVPLLHAILVITGVVLINKALDVLIFRYPAMERMMNGSTREVVRDGVIHIPTMRAQKIGHSELFESMREAGLVNVGQIRRAYLETSGRFSYFRADGPKLGLPIEPAWAVAPPVKIGAGAPISQPMACCVCGTVLTTEGKVTPAACPNCGASHWTQATLQS
ncbi:YetF domain-containing protein [Pseudorhodobacter sp.]|uniref:YetF domain-containing protein n=1 Tax=Pseudorhodobacter sp. TaxID=1934400 RepID=UPI002649D5B1|nr:YetF domain-containing protein [Pseudorhodobacter sp.]MDN5787608.1 DUF421 domain-containing protein [Pseudorhodobacter sp.]